MGLIDFILNLAGVLLWLGWRSIRFDPLGRSTPATLVGTLVDLVSGRDVGAREARLSNSS